jgi:hypothetical protein
MSSNDTMLAGDVHLKLSLDSCKDPSTFVVCPEFFSKEIRYAISVESSTYGVLMGILAYFLSS